jgi:hypothetical protein
MTLVDDFLLKASTTEAVVKPTFILIPNEEEMRKEELLI